MHRRQRRRRLLQMKTVIDKTERISIGGEKVSTIEADVNSSGNEMPNNQCQTNIMLYLGVSMNEER